VAAESSVLFGAFLLSLVHSAIPNHWGPFVLVGSLRRWSRTKLAAVTCAAGFLHSSVTLALGLAIAYAGQTYLKTHQDLLESLSAAILIGLGVLLILGRMFGRHLHRHFEPSKYSAATEALMITALIGMLSLSPCAEILPLYLLAAADSWRLVLLLSAVVVVTTTLGMTAIVMAFGDRLSNMRWKFIEENGGLITGVLLAALGLWVATHGEMDMRAVADAMGRFGLAALRGGWNIYQDAAPYILFGCLMGGLVYAFLSPERVAGHLGRGRFKPVVKAALFGIPLPLCSCGVIPAALSLRRMGASRGATSAFLITTPETGVDSIAVTYALLDPIYTVFRPVAAFCTGVTAGVLEVLFGEKETSAAPSSDQGTCDKCHPAEPRPPAPARPTILAGLQRAVTYGLGDFLEDMSLWLLIGFLAAGVIMAAVPPEALERALGGGLPGMLIMLLVSIPLYICASATTPLAAALLLKGASPGAALVFLLAGPASNTAGIVMLARFMGKRSVAIYLASIAFCSLAFGLLLNHIYLWLGLNPRATVGAHHVAESGDFKLYCAVALGALILYHLIRRSWTWR